MIKNVLLGLLVLLILARLFAPSTEIAPYSKLNTKVPEFTLETLDGKDYFYSSDLAKGVSILTFMSYTCGYCTDQSKYMQNVKFGVPIYVISVNFDKEGVEAWADQNHIKHYYKKFGVKGNEIGKAFDVSGVPVNFIIKDGVIVERILGMISDTRYATVADLIAKHSMN